MKASTICHHNLVTRLFGCLVCTRKVNTYVKLYFGVPETPETVSYIRMCGGIRRMCVLPSLQAFLLQQYITHGTPQRAMVQCNTYSPTKDHYVRQALILDLN
eukprot:5543602-Amphidinium_carterae.1